VLLRSAATGRYVTVADDRLVASAASPAGATRFGREVLTGGIQEAARLAAEADVAVVAIGNAPLINGRETQDRMDIRPSACQRRLVRAVVGANPRTVLLVESSYPMAIPWEQSHVPAILWSSHGGQEMGSALADVLFGDHAPAGRLTQTWYRSARDLGDLADYDVIGSRRTYLYFDGTPLYPFGHGLTYPEFRYEELRLEPAVVGSAGTVVASVRVTNAGSVASDEVVQLYTRKRTSRVEQPRRRLGAFERAHFAPGETRTLRLELRAADLAVWDVARGRFVVEAGAYDVLVGASSDDIRLDAALEAVGETIGPRDGASIAAADFDDAFRVAIVDETRERGDAVAPVQDGAWIAFRDVDLGAGVDRVELRACRVGRGRGTVEVRLDGPSAGAPLAGAEVPCTGGLYEWTNVSAPVRAASGVHDLYLVLSGDIRLARFGFSRDAAAR
jgi:beta-glucosidase